MVFDPLIKVRDARELELIPPEIYSVIVKRFSIVEMGIQRIERASGLKYPRYYIDPTLIIAAPSSADFQFAQFGFLFAQTIPVVKKNNEVEILIRITAPLVIYGLLGTIHAILAHEFMHYLELLNRIMKMDIISDELTASLFENRYRDSGRLLEAKCVFRSDQVLRDHIAKKFPEGFKDSRLEEKTIKYWMNRGLPSVSVPLDSNIIKIPVEAMAGLKVGREIREKILEFERAAIQKLKNKI
jgi:hypothetical protein